MHINLDHIHLFATDLPATTAFFTRMFDATTVWDEQAAGVRNVRLAVGSGFIHLYDQAPKGPRGGAVHHIGIATDDLEGLVASMKAKGYVFRNEIRHDPRFSYVMVSGPDGLLIELFQTNEPQRWGMRSGINAPAPAP